MELLYVIAGITGVICLGTFMFEVAGWVGDSMDPNIQHKEGSDGSKH